MDKPKQKFADRISKFLSEDKKTVKKNILLGSVVAVLIAGSPFLFYLYESVPAEPTWDTFLFTYHSGFYGNVQVAMWMLSGKLIPLFFLIIWFFTCRHWWYHALIVPIAMYIYQIVLAIQQDANKLDEFDLIYLLPIMAIIIPSIYLIRAKMFDKINDANKTVQDLEDEFRISPKGFWERLRQYF
jgi:hypothetical protein